MKNGNGPRPKTTGNLMRELMQTERLDRYLEKNDGQMVDTTLADELKKRLDAFRADPGGSCPPFRPQPGVRL